MFELLTGDYLFDPQSGTKYGKDDDHVAQIIELLGSVPQEIAMTGKWSGEIFNRRGELRNIHRLRHWAIADVLRDKYHLDPPEADIISSFLVPMLQVDAKKRADAGGMSSHPWLSNTRGMEQISLGLETGACGDGITGWASEVKRA